MQSALVHNWTRLTCKTLNPPQTLRVQPAAHNNAFILLTTPSAGPGKFVTLGSWSSMIFNEPQHHAQKRQVPSTPLPKPPKPLILNARAARGLNPKENPKALKFNETLRSRSDLKVSTAGAASSRLRPGPAAGDHSHRRTWVEGFCASVLCLC